MVFHVDRGTTGPTTGRVEWESYKHDNRNTGNYHTPLEQGTKAIAINPDIDGDGVPNDEDCDIDGDGVVNWEDDDVDDDIDGDGVPNDWDYEMDGDGIPNELDDTPYGPTECRVVPKDKNGCGCQAGAPASDAGLPLLVLLAFGLICMARRRRR